MNVANHFSQTLGAGTHEFRPINGADYILKVTSENGGPTAISLRDNESDANGITDPDFTSGEAYGAIITIPLGSRLFITLAGQESVSIRIHRRPDQ